MAWLTGTASQRALSGGTGRTFRDQHAWCWNIRPEIAVTGQVYDEVQVDGIYLRSGWCALIAITDQQVIGWQWCDREKQVSWAALLSRFPAPRVVVTDGQAGILAAVAECWPATRVQRCLVHVQRNIRTYLTLQPRTDAGRTLRALSLSLTRITRDAATTWLTRLNDWHQAYGHLTRRRTYRHAVHAAAVPSWTRPGQTWWYTHDRLRKAYRLLAKLARKDVLFTYLDPAFDSLGISSTTNEIEGGINAQLRTMLKAHRGMTPDHARRAIEWWCYQHSEAPRPPADLIRPAHWQPPAPAVVVDEPDGPAGYDTATSADEGLWARKGWAGRT